MHPFDRKNAYKWTCWQKNFVFPNRQPKQEQRKLVYYALQGGGRRQSTRVSSPRGQKYFFECKKIQERDDKKTPCSEGCGTGCCHNSGLFLTTRSFRIIRIIRITLTTLIIQTTQTILLNPFMLIIHRICALSGQRYKIPSPPASKRGEYFSLLNKYKNDAGGVNTSYKVNLCR